MEYDVYFSTILKLSPAVIFRHGSTSKLSPSDTTKFGTLELHGHQLPVYCDPAVAQTSFEKQGYHIHQLKTVTIRQM
jgi:hypothetical protein